MGCVLLGLLWGACEDEPPPAPPPPPPPAPPRVEVAAPRELATDASFDLVVGSRGPLWIYGAPSEAGGELRLVPLDRRGGAAGPERTLVGGGSVGSELPPDAVEIAAGAADGRLAVAWVRRNQTQLSVRAAYGDDAGEAFSPPVALGPTLRTRAGGRGHVAVAAEANDFEVLHRGDLGPCEEGAPPERPRCTRMGVTRLGPGTTERRGVGLALPQPCERAVVGFASVGGVWYYALCDGSGGAPATTVFAVQFEPRYAHAERVLEGCAPRGLVPFGDGVVVLGRCDEGMRGMRIASAGRALQPLSGAPRVDCLDGRPRVRIDAWEDRWDAPRERVEALLPEEVAPEGSRAVWTGEAVLIATPLGREVALRRYECGRGGFHRTDHE
ncbi:MAG: hypothetical protein CMN31_14620 [Sandaracinus sp.]|nr:hypothetical protein [Myxococcales bacterium]MBJ72548.1 hypothetical protein [Sandaracinus sp.]